MMEKVKFWERHQCINDIWIMSMAFRHEVWCFWLIHQSTKFHQNLNHLHHLCNNFPFPFTSLASYVSTLLASFCYVTPTFSNKSIPGWYINMSRLISCLVSFNFRLFHHFMLIGVSISKYNYIKILLKHSLHKIGILNAKTI